MGATSILERQSTVLKGLPPGYEFSTPQVKSINNKEIRKEQLVTLPENRKIIIQPFRKILPYSIRKIPLDELHKRNNRYIQQNTWKSAETTPISAQNLYTSYVQNQQFVICYHTGSVNDRQIQRNQAPPVKCSTQFSSVHPSQKLLQRMEE